jgi:fatty acid synthase
LNDAEFLNDASNSLSSRGYIISREDTVVDLTTFKNLPTNFQLISVIPTAENETLVLLQHTTEKADPPKVLRITNSEDDTYEWLEKLKKLILVDSVVVYSQNEPFSGILGLVTCLRKETVFNNLRCVFIDDPHAPSFDIDHPFYAEQLSLGLAINVLRNGQWGAYRHLPMIQKNEVQSTTDPLFADILTKGDLSSFRWFQKSIENSNANEIVSVKYAALNFRDVLTATGKLVFDVESLERFGTDCPLGFEFSGVTGDGRRVMGMLNNGAFVTHMVLKAMEPFIMNCPDNWTLEEAATIPIIYFTVYLAFFELMRIEEGKSILIHAGSGGVGLSAIRVALAYGLEVFTTVSTEDKKLFLTTVYPQLKKENIGNSRDTSFEEMIMRNKNGRGVDYILNSLAQEKLMASIRCLAQHGSFVEIGLSDILNNSKIDMKYLGTNKSFNSFVLIEYLKDNPKKFMVSFELRALKLLF